MPGAKDGAATSSTNSTRRFRTPCSFAREKACWRGDLDAELDRLFREQVEPLREARRGAAEIRTRSDVRARAADYFRNEKILRLMQRGVRVEEFTVPGDPMRIDFSYRRNGTRGFVHVAGAGARSRAGQAPGVHGGRDSRHASRIPEFLAVTETRAGARQRAATSLSPDVLEENGIPRGAARADCASGPTMSRRCCVQAGESVNREMP